MFWLLEIVVRVVATKWKIRIIQTADSITFEHRERKQKVQSIVWQVIEILCDWKLCDSKRQLSEMFK